MLLLLAGAAAQAGLQLARSKYSGELYFGGRALRALALPATCTLVAIRDVNLLSALVMNGVSVYVIAFLVASGEAKRLFEVAPSAGPYFALGGVLYRDPRPSPA